MQSCEVVIKLPGLKCISINFICILFKIKIAIKRFFTLHVLEINLILISVYIFSLLEMQLIFKWMNLDYKYWKQWRTQPFGSKMFKWQLLIVILYFVGFAQGKTDIGPLHDIIKDYNCAIIVFSPNNLTKDDDRNIIKAVHDSGNIPLLITSFNLTSHANHYGQSCFVSHSKQMLMNVHFF